MGIFSVIICLVCVALFAVKVKKAVRKAFPVPGAPEADINDGNFDTFYEDGQAVREDDEYFSYENVPGNTCFTSQSNPMKPKDVDMSPVNETDDRVSSVDFDLRQAVIYNTILHNDYIGERY
ncbi:MAG: hypothetical protein J5711_10340 [Bacteroidales bacterium]|nr:hypothetical protein [Bacteroidales bacterium]